MALAKTCCGAIKRFRLELPNFLNPPPITVLQGMKILCLTIFDE